MKCSAVAAFECSVTHNLALGTLVWPSEATCRFLNWTSGPCAMVTQRVTFGEAGVYSYEPNVMMW